MSTAKKKDLNSLGSIYGDMLNGVKRNIIKENKVKEGEIGEVPLKDGGPTEKGGFVEPKLDKNKMSEKELEDNLYDIENLSYGEEDEENEKDCDCEGDCDCKKADENTQKIATESLNNFMRKKSIFDKLYENVIGADQMGMEDAEDLNALGIEGGEGEDSFEMEAGGDEVTITLDRETAQKLHDLLMAAVSGEEEGGDEEGGDEDEFGGEEGSDDLEEDEEDLGHPGVNAKEPNFGKNNKVGNLKPQSGGATSKYTDKVGDDGDYGHALVNAKEPNYGKNNKVGNLKPNKSLFEQ